MKRPPVLIWTLYYPYFLCLMTPLKSPLGDGVPPSSNIQEPRFNRTKFFSSFKTNALLLKNYLERIKWIGFIIQPGASKIMYFRVVWKVNLSQNCRLRSKVLQRPDKLHPRMFIAIANSEKDRTPSWSRSNNCLTRIYWKSWEIIFAKNLNILPIRMFS